jgi:predicted site-specific integrase-resolvase
MYGFVKQWATQQEVKEIFSIGKNQLGEWVRAGYIKVFGGGKPGSTRRYCCEDIHRVMTREALGKKQILIKKRR